MTRPKALDGQMALPMVPSPQVPALAVHIRSGWREDAACATYPGDGFYPEDDTPPETTTAARSVCNRCPVRDSCRAFALLHEEEHGIWGGMTAEERDTLRGELSLGETTVTSALVREYPNHRLPWKNRAA